MFSITKSSFGLIQTSPYHVCQTEFYPVISRNADFKSTGVQQWIQRLVSQKYLSIHFVPILTPDLRQDSTG